VADDVQVKFGAQLDGLVAGINEAKSQLESVTAPISGIKDAFSGLAEVAGAAFAVDKIIEFSEHYAELGEQIERTSQILGISTDQVQELGFAIRMGGGDAETATLTIGILEKNIAEAASGSGTAATAFENMGIAVKGADGNTRSAVDILKDMADVLSKVSDANIRAEYGRALLGRGYQNLLPVLLEGREGFDKLNAILDQTNSKLSNDQVKALDESAKKTKELSASWDGLVIELGADTAWTGAKQDAIDLTQSMTSLAKAIGEATHELGEFLGLADQKAEPTALGEFNAEAAKFRLAIAKQNGASPQQYGPNLPPGIKLPSLGKEQGGAEKDNGEEDYYKNLYQTEIESSHLAFEQVQQDQQGLVDAKKETATEGLQAVIAALGLEKQTVMSALDQEAGLYEQDSVEYAQVQNKKAIATQQFALEASRLNTDLAKAQEADLKKTEESYNAMFGSIDRAMDGALQGVLQGTQSLTQAMARLFGDMVTSVLEDIAKIALRWGAFQASQAAFGAGDSMTKALGSQVPGALGGAQQNTVLGSAMTKLAGLIGLNTAAHTAGTLATTSNTVATTAGAVATTGSTVATSAGTVATALNTTTTASSGVLHVAAMAENTLATAANTIATWAGDGLKALIPLATGAWNIPSDMPAFLHAGEMVVPADAAAAIRGGGSFGGGAPGATSGASGNFTININAIDTQTGAQFLKQHASVIAQTLNGQARNFNPAMRVN
jgi:hypothetical protein